MIKNIFVIFSILLIGNIVSAQEISYILQENFDPSVHSEQLNASELMGGQGLTYYEIGLTGAYAKSWSTENLDSSDYFKIQINPKSGFSFNLKKIEFSERRSLSGVQYFKCIAKLNNQFTLLLETEIPDDDAERSWKIENIHLKCKETDTLEIYWYAYRAESSTGSWRINDTSLNIYGEIEELNQNDISSLVCNSDKEIIPKLISSESNTIETLNSVLSFKIKDLESGDGKPSLPIRMAFQLESANNPIKNGALYTNDLIIPDSSYWESNNLILTFKPGQILIPDGDSLEFDLLVSLKENNIIDGSSFRFFIDSINTYWQTSIEGSAFDEFFPERINSPFHSISVYAKSIYLNQQIDTCTINMTFDIHAFASDKNGNIDTDFSESVLIIPNHEPNTIFEDGNSLNFNMGFASINNLFFNSYGIHQLCFYSAEHGIKDTVSLFASPEYSVICTKPVIPISSGDLTNKFNSIGKTVEVFKFKVVDNSSIDGLPVLLHQLCIKNPKPLNSADWSNTIEGIKLKCEDEQVLISDIQITDKQILIIPATEIKIDNKESSEITLSIYVNESKLVDNRILEFEIDSINHAFQTKDTSSFFRPIFPEKIKSNSFQITIHAKQLTAKTPKIVGVNMPFAIEILAVDSFEIVDLDFHASFKVSLYSGEGSLFLNDSLLKIENGNCKMDSLLFDGNGIFRLKIESDSLGTFLSEEIISADANSTVIVPDFQPPGHEISSLNSRQENAIEVLRFSIEDSAETDTLSTLIQKMVFKNMCPANSVDWIKSISNAFVQMESQNYKPENIQIKEDKISLYFPENPIEIKSGEKINLSLFLVLHSFPLIEKQNLQIYIPSKDHEWEVAGNESSYLREEFLTDVYSNLYRIDNVATQLNLSSPSLLSNKKDTVILQINLVDSSNNIDHEASSFIHIFLNDSLITNSNQEIINDSFYSLVMVDEVNEIIVKDAYNASTSDTLIVHAQDSLAIITHLDFETGIPNLEHFWTISDYLPIQESQSLMHGKDQGFGSSSFVFNPDSLYLNTAVHQWRLQCKTNVYNLSSSNTFGIWFSATDTIFTKEQFSGYFLALNYKSKNDSLVFYKANEGDFTAIKTLGSKWFETDQKSFKIVVNPKGEWSIYIKEEAINSHYSLCANFNESSWQHIKSSGFYSDYSETNEGTIWLDNISIQRINYIPFIRDYSFLTNSLLAIDFSENILISSNSEININDRFNMEFKADSFWVHENVLFISAKFKGPSDFRMEFKNLSDESNSNFSLKKDILFIPYPGFNEIVINEIMVDPEPTIDLPALEYIELFNSLDYPINLENWKLIINTNEFHLPEKIIPAKGFLVLCKSDTSFFGDQLFTISSLSALPNTKGIVYLYNSIGDLVSFLEYTDALYQDEEKRDGGWSLERVSPTNYHSDFENMSASKNSHGGSPGERNSIFQAIHDFVGPEIESVQIIELNKLSVKFDEQIRIDSDKLNQFLLNGEFQAIYIESDSLLIDELLVYFSNNFEEGKTYKLEIFELTDLLGNESPVQSIDFIKGMKAEKNDLLFNEILFNPYPESCDFIEFYNPSEKPLDLSHLYLTNLKDTVHAADSAIIVYPNEYFVFCESKEEILMHYNALNEDCIYELKTLPSMPDNEGTIVLFTNEMHIDSFYYHENMHIDLLSDNEGKSLERVSSEINTNQANNWHTASETSGFATPTSQNSQDMELYSENSTISLSPEVFSPDNDGYKDQLSLIFSFDKPGYLLSVSIFNMQGSLIKRLVSNMLSGIDATLFWDGRSDGENALDAGIYIINVEYFDLDGNYFQEKDLVF